jgi:hypothetical protein
VARCEELDAILQAQFELEYAEPEVLEERRHRLHFLVDQIIANTSLTRHDLLSAVKVIDPRSNKLLVVKKLEEAR